MNRKALLLLFVVLAMFASSVFATESRMAALGNPFGYIRDNSDISAYPGVINQYERNLVAELGSGSDWKVGANLPFMGNVLGVYLNTDTDIDVNSKMNLLGNNYSNGDLSIAKKIQFYYSFMEKFGVGFGMAIDSKKKELAADKYAEMSASYFTLTGGMSDEKMDIGGGLAFWGAGNKNDINTDETSAGGFSFNAQGRYFVMENDDFDLVAAANLGINSGSMEYKSTATSTKDESGMVFGLGAGMNYKFDENNHLIFVVKPLNLESSGWEAPGSPSGTDKGSEAWMYVPTYKIGLESQIKPWLTGRIGASQQYCFHSETDDPEGTALTEEADYMSSYGYDMGLAFKVGKFTIDAVLNQMFLHNGPNFISGASSNLASNISITYVP